MGSASVVDLKGVSPSKSRLGRSKQTNGVQAGLEALQRNARARLNALLIALLNSADDELFERADRSSSDSDHQKYFESMRHLRLARSEVLKRFDASIKDAFAKLKSPPQDEWQNPSSQFEAAEFSLVQQDDLEVTVAIAGLVSKVTSQYSLAITQLTKRLDHVHEHVAVTDKLNPLGPQVLGEGFASAIETLDVELTIRLIILKLFERFVMDQLGDFYDEANRQLAASGVLPDLKHAYRRARSADRPERNAAQTPASYVPPLGSPTQTGVSPGAVAHGDSTTSGTGFGYIQGLMSQQAGSHHSDATTSSGVTVVPTDQLVEVLGQLQLQGPTETDPTVAPSAIDLSALLAGRMHQLTGDKSASLNRNDDDVVNFVGMLFDYILNDRNLAIPMKALIARLQIPIVKLAILDKSFFSRASHPARRLLNELSSAGIGWSSASELKRDALYDMIENIVARVLNDFQGEVAVFDTLTKDLQQFVTKDRTRTRRVESRVKESEEGKAKTQDAKRCAQNVINQKAAGLRLHPKVGRFISDIWSRVLVFVALKHGNTSSEWTDAVADLDELLWAVQPLNNLEDVLRRDTGREALLSQLRTGMQGINLPNDDIESALSALDAHLAEISRHDRAFLEHDAPPTLLAKDEVREVIKEVQLAEPLEEAPIVEETAGAIDTTAVDGLHEGRWLEFTSGSNDPVRCKLATVIGGGNRFIFVNRRGMKVAEKTRTELAQGIAQGEVVILDDSEVFDKALEAVIGNLRQLRSSTAS